MRNFAACIFFGVLLTACSTQGDEEEDELGISAAERQQVMSQAGLPSVASGNWETNLAVEEIDLPALASSRKAKIVAEIEKDGSKKRCLSEKEAKEVSVRLFATNDDDCLYREFSITDGKAKMSLSCGVDSISTVDMELIGPISADSYDFDADISIRLPMIGNVKARGKLSGKNTGPCSQPS